MTSEVCHAEEDCGQDTEEGTSLEDSKTLSEPNHTSPAGTSRDVKCNACLRCLLELMTPRLTLPRNLAVIQLSLLQADSFPTNHCYLFTHIQPLLLQVMSKTQGLPVRSSCWLSTRFNILLPELLMPLSLITGWRQFVWRHASGATSGPQNCCWRHWDHHPISA